MDGIASPVEREDPDDAAVIQGRVSGQSSLNSRLRLMGLSVKTDNFTVFRVEGQETTCVEFFLENHVGSLVEVKSTQDRVGAGVLTATEVNVISRNP